LLLWVLAVVSVLAALLAVVEGTGRVVAEEKVDACMEVEELGEDLVAVLVLVQRLLLLLVLGADPAAPAAAELLLVPAGEQCVRRIRLPPSAGHLLHLVRVQSVHPCIA
jgi:hypothetical protein